MDVPKLPPENSTPDVVAEIKNWLFAHFGWAGLAALAVFYAWRNWEELKKLPGIRSLVNRPKHHPIPRADPSRFSILVARLEHDSDDGQRHLVMQTLSEFEGIQVLGLDRRITLGASDTGEAERLGHDQARKYLAEAQAHVVLWGTVLKQGAHSLPKLYWTAASAIRLDKHSDRYPANDHDLRLPELFWEDLTAVLGTVALTQASEFDGQRGCFLADRLWSFIEKLRTLLSGAAASTPLSLETRTLQWILASALTTYGEQSGVNAALEDAVDIYKAISQEYTRESVPLVWAMAQNNLGKVLQVLGQREIGTARLEEAVGAFRSVLPEQTRERVPLDWAMTQNNLGNALSTLGERESSTARLEQAVAAYRFALLEYTRERVPMDWAMTQNNLGGALSRLGERESSTARLEEAVAAYRFSLLENTRERAPLNWAVTQNNLGNALRALGLREHSTARLEEAASAYRAALLEQSREHVPLAWAMTQNNLGNALSTLGARRRDATLLCTALEHHLAALEVLAVDAPYYANVARRGVATTTETLKTLFNSSDYVACLEHHQGRIERLMGD